MREIKFRVWDKEYKKMDYPSRKTEMLESTYWDRFSNTGCIEWRSEDFKFLQYTGLHDKNGREIYEGDIVKYESKIVADEPLKCLIEYEEDASILCINGIDKRSKQYYRSNCVIFHKSIGKDCEVIGNIYDNPELLKESD